MVFPHRPDFDKHNQEECKIVTLKSSSEAYSFVLHPAIIIFIFKSMAEAVGFEPTHGLTRLSVFKTDPFSHLGTPPCITLYGGPCRTRTCDRTVMSRLL